MDVDGKMENGNGKNKDDFKDPFQAIQSKNKHSKIVQVLKDRLPMSGNIYNMALTLHKFEKEMHCFTLHGIVDKDALIVIIFTREDYGQDINISLPSSFIPNEEIKQAFTSTKAIHWNHAHLFVAVDRRIANLIFEIDTRVFKNSVIYNPAYTYWICPESLRKNRKNDEIHESGNPVDPFIVKPLEIEKGVKFFLEHWKSARAGSSIYMSKIIANNKSAGVYDTSTNCLVGAAVLSGYGFIGPIHTLGSYRRRGIGSKCMRYLLQEMADSHLAPVSSSAQNNKSYVSLHERLGMTQVAEADWIFFTGSGGGSSSNPTPISAPGKNDVKTDNVASSKREKACPVLDVDEEESKFVKVKKIKREQHCK